MKKNEAGFSAIEGLLILVLVAIIGFVGWYIYHRQHNGKQVSQIVAFPDQPPASKAAVAAAADKFLITRVGEINFQKFYKQEPTRTSYANPKDSKFDFIAYNFLPIKAFSEGDDVVTVQVNRNNLGEIYTDSGPDCRKDASQCNFTVTKNQALTIARSHGLSGDISLDLNYNPEKEQKTMVIIAESCVEKKAVYINYSNGQFLGTGQGCISLEL